LKGGLEVNALATAPRTATVVLLPKNRGLAGQAARAFRQRMPDDAVEYAVRGEDVPLLASELAAARRRVLAFTGEDLLDEWLRAGNALDPGLVRARELWSDPAAIYGAPALCLIGAGNLPADTGASVRIAVCARYARLAQSFVSDLRNGGLKVDCITIQGSLETVVLQGLADFIIDVVVTGRTIAQAGLRVARVISLSDLAVLESRS
jgi:ATP phosphoribosyltransferase